MFCIRFRKKSLNAVLRVLLSTNLEYNLAEAAKAMLGPTTTKWGNRQCFDLRFFYVRMVKSINETFKKKSSSLQVWEGNGGPSVHDGEVQNQCKAVEGGERECFWAQNENQVKMEAFQPRLQLPFLFAVKFYHGRTRSRAHMHWSPTSWWCSTWSRGRFPSFLSFFFSFIGSTEKLGPSQVQIFFCSFSGEFDIP